MFDPAPQIEVTRDGQKTLNLLHQRGPYTGAQLPDMIPLDLNMPGLDGRQLLAVMKPDPQLKHIPIVVLTTSGAPDDIIGSYDHHANAYVTKPTDLFTLTSSVHQIVAFCHPDRPPLNAPPSRRAG